MFCCHIIDTQFLFTELTKWICVHDYVDIYVDILHCISEFMLNYTATQGCTAFVLLCTHTYTRVSHVCSETRENAHT